MQRSWRAYFVPWQWCDHPCPNCYSCNLISQGFSASNRLFCSLVEDQIWQTTGQLIILLPSPHHIKRNRAIYEWIATLKLKVTL